MSFRPELKPYRVLTSSVMSASRNGDATVIQKLSVISYQFIWTGTPTGTVGIQVSNDYSLDATGTVSNTGTWSTYWFMKSDGTFVTSLSTGGAAGNAYIELPALGSYAVRPIYTFSSGTGTLNIYVCGKVQ